MRLHRGMMANSIKHRFNRKQWSEQYSTYNTVPTFFGHKPCHIIVERGTIKVDYSSVSVIHYDTPGLLTTATM